MTAQGYLIDVRSMTNVEIQMSKECPNVEWRKRLCTGLLTTTDNSDFRHSTFFRHSSFDIQNLRRAFRLTLRCHIRCVYPSNRTYLIKVWSIRIEGSGFRDQGPEKFLNSVLDAQDTQLWWQIFVKCKRKTGQSTERPTSADRTVFSFWILNPDPWLLLTNCFTGQKDSDKCAY